MKLILSRHGNTFNPGATATWAGSRNDLPLVEQGITQAKILGASLKKAQIKPAAIYCGPLQRTRVYAEIVIETLNVNLQPIIEQRLNEIDYGDWSGLVNEQIRAQFDASALAAWEQFSAWPGQANWQGSEQIMLAEIHALSQDIINHYHSDDTILFISSNGRLRYFLDLIAPGFKQQIAQRTFKVATGNICQLTYAQQWQLDYWNLTPLVALIA